MKLNNFMFKEEYAYTYEEVYDALELENPYSLDSGTLVDNMIDLHILALNGTKVDNTYFYYSFVKDGETSNDAINNNTLALLKKVWLRYKDHYAIVIDSEANLETKSKEFMIKLLNVLDYTFEKYDALLSMYADNKSKLLDKLERTRSEEKSGESEVSSESSSGSKSAGSDTPQTINVSQDIGEIAGYFNRYDQAQDEASSSSEGSNSETIEATETFDPTTLMARIDEIQKQYENTMFKWVEEFDRLFIEEGNI